SIEALRSGQTLGAPRSELAASAQPAAVVVRATPAPPRPAQEPVSAGAAPSWSLRGAVLYEVAALGHGPGLTHGPLLGVLVRPPLALQLGVLLSAQYRFPFEVD